MRQREQPSFDAVVVGTGFGGVHMLQRLRQLGFSASVFEAGGGQLHRRLRLESAQLFL